MEFKKGDAVKITKRIAFWNDEWQWIDIMDNTLNQIYIVNDVMAYGEYSSKRTKTYRLNNDFKYPEESLTLATEEEVELLRRLEHIPPLKLRRMLRVSLIEGEIMPIEKTINYIKCPFCNEDDFDLIGLKRHFLNGWCSVFEVTDLTEEFPKKVKDTDVWHDGV